MTDAVTTGQTAKRAAQLTFAESVPLSGRIGRRQACLLAGAIVLAPIVLAAAAPAVIAPHAPMLETAAALSRPSLAHPFGSDDLGRDLLSMVIAGARSALMIAAIATSLSVAIGLMIGLIAGFFGGLADEALMRVTEFVKILPRFLVALLIATLFGPSLFGLCLVLGLMSWPGLARMVRAETLVQRGREHVLAAHSLGADRLGIMLRHIMPAAAQPVLAVLAPIATSAILAEAGLGYLGLSDPAMISWGDLIRNGQEFYAHGWWLSFFPGLAVIATCLGLAMVVEGIDWRGRRG